MSDFISNELFSFDFPVLVYSIVAVVVCIVVGYVFVARKGTPSRSSFEDELLEEEATTKKKSKPDTASKKKKQKKPTKPVTNGNAVQADAPNDAKMPSGAKALAVKTESEKIKDKSKGGKPTSQQSHVGVSKTTKPEIVSDDWTVTVGKKKQKGGKKECSVPPAAPLSTDEGLEVQKMEEPEVTAPVRFSASFDDHYDAEVEMEIDSVEIKESEIFEAIPAAICSENLQNDDTDQKVELVPETISGEAFTSNMMLVANSDQTDLGLSRTSKKKKKKNTQKADIELAPVDIKEPEISESVPAAVCRENLQNGLRGDNEFEVELVLEGRSGAADMDQPDVGITRHGDLSKKKKVPTATLR